MALCWVSLTQIPIRLSTRATCPPWIFKKPRQFWVIIGQSGPRNWVSFNFYITNLAPRHGLCNDTCMILTKYSHLVLEVHMLSRPYVGEHVFIFSHMLSRAIASNNVVVPHMDNTVDFHTKNIVYLEAFLQQSGFFSKSLKSVHGKSHVKLVPYYMRWLY